MGFICFSRKPGILTQSSTEFINRPATAGQLYNTSQDSTTQPPSPYKKAWGSGNPSPMVFVCIFLCICR